MGDFGIATVAAEASLTQTGQVLGTAAYISPEQARGHAATDASDRYALAVVAFELLTGRRPFTADHPAAQARAHVEDRVPSASAAATGLPPRVDRVLAMGMAKDPAQRPATAADFMDDIEDAIDGEIAPAGPPTAVTAPVAPAPARTDDPLGPRRACPDQAPLARHGRPGRPRRRGRRGHRDRRRGGGKGGGGAGTDKPRALRRTAPRRPSPSPRPRRLRRPPAPAQRPPRRRPRPPPAATTQGPPAAQATSDDAVALNNQGFALIGQGNAAGAVQPLQRSVAAFRAQGRKADVNYAYALYNLGNALRLSGHPADAIPYLQERLQISNYKRGIVKKELATAKQQAGQ